MAQACINNTRWHGWNVGRTKSASGSASASLNVTELSHLADEDVRLLQQIAQEDRQAFGVFYDRYSNVLFSTALRILNDRTEAADVTQDVFLQIWNKSGTYDPALGKPFHWAMTLIRNKAIDRLRSRKRRYEFMEELAGELSGDAFNLVDDDVFSHEKASLIRVAVETLPLEQRQAIEMAFLGGMTQEQISQQLQQPLGTIKARIRRGMLKLRENLKGVL
jgi:RNA polymerase sigma-70 factor (ECF subfamily)